MARLDGKKKSPLPVIIGLAALLLLGVGGYYLMQNRGADSVSVTPGDVTVSDTRPGNMVSNGVDAESNGNEVTIGSESSKEEGSEVKNADSDNTATQNSENSATPPVTIAGASDKGADSNSANSGESLGSKGSSGAEATRAGDGENKPLVDGASKSAKESADSPVMSERSKTIKNNKTGTTVTYTKKVRDDGSVSHEKSTSSEAKPSGTAQKP